MSRESGHGDGPPNLQALLPAAGCYNLAHQVLRVPTRQGLPEYATLPLLERGIENATKYMATTNEQRRWRKLAKERANNKIFLHLKYHPCDPPSPVLQRLWRRCVLHPPGKPHLTCLQNQFGERLPINRLVIAYGRHQNIGNLLSYRNISKRPGPKVSSFL